MMGEAEMVALERDVEASIVPSGTRVTLEKGESVTITQSLGGTFTVVVNGNMFLGLFGSDIFARLSPADRAQLSGTVMLDRNQLPLHSYA